MLLNTITKKKHVIYLKLVEHEQEEGAEITANSLHPGVISTNLFRHIFTPPSFAEGMYVCFHNLYQK